MISDAFFGGLSVIYEKSPRFLSVWVGGKNSSSKKFLGRFPDTILWTISLSTVYEKRRFDMWGVFFGMFVVIVLYSTVWDFERVWGWKASYLGWDVLKRVRYGLIQPCFGWWYMRGCFLPLFKNVVFSAAVSKFMVFNRLEGVVEKKFLMEGLSWFGGVQNGSVLEGEAS